MGFHAEMRQLLASVASLLGILVTTPAVAFTPGEIAAAAEVAREVRADVERLAADDLDGRSSGTESGAATQEILIDRLVPIGPGLDSSSAGRDAYRQPFDGVRTNLLAVIPGGARADEVVLIGAHYDHFASFECNVLDDPICNGATDNAAGVAVVLAIGRALRALPTPPARSVVLALWDGEERGLLGSRHFVESPLVPLADIAAYVNFDIQGSNLTPSARDVSFVLGAESGGALLTDLTEDAIATVGLGTRRLTVTFGQARSDYQPFWARGVPVAFFSDATNACYHTTSDDVDVVDFAKLARQAEIGFRLVLSLAEAEERPSYVPLGPLDTYEDLVVLSELLTLALADVELVYPGYQDSLVSLEELARERVAAGPDAFNPTDALSIALDAIDITTNGLPCDPLLLPEPGTASGAALAALVVQACARRRRD